MTRLFDIWQWLYPNEPSAKPSPKGTLYTIGHGNEKREDLLKITKSAFIVDVRSKPYSRWCPSCNKKAMEKEIGEDGYVSLPQLGGLGWTEPSERQEAIEEVRKALEEEDIVLLCAESDPAQCHRVPLAEEISQGKFQVVHLDNKTGRGIVNVKSNVRLGQDGVAEAEE